MTSLLLDTHTFLWFVWNHQQLSATSRSLIEDPRNMKLVSMVSCWEIAIKCGSGKLKLGEPSSSFLPREISRNNFETLAIELPHVVGVESLPSHHGDPFDRLLISQALCDGLTVLSADAAFDQYGVKRIW